MNRLIALSLLFLFAVGAHAQRAVATLDRSTVAVGEGVGFSIACENFQPSNTPRLPFIPGLRIAGAGSGRSFQLGGGQQTSTLTYNFLITPNKTGTYTLPALSIPSRRASTKRNRSNSAWSRRTQTKRRGESPTTPLCGSWSAKTRLMSANRSRWRFSSFYKTAVTTRRS